MKCNIDERPLAILHGEIQANSRATVPNARKKMRKPRGIRHVFVWPCLSDPPSSTNGHTLDLEYRSPIACWRAIAYNRQKAPHVNASAKDSIAIVNETVAGLAYRLLFLNIFKRCHHATKARKKAAFTVMATGANLEYYTDCQVANDCRE